MYVWNIPSTKWWYSADPLNECMFACVVYTKTCAVNPRWNPNNIELVLNRRMNKRPFWLFVNFVKVRRVDTKVWDLLSDHLFLSCCDVICWHSWNYRCVMLSGWDERCVRVFRAQGKYFCWAWFSFRDNHPYIHQTQYNNSAFPQNSVISCLQNFAKSWNSSDSTHLPQDSAKFRNLTTLNGWLLIEQYTYEFTCWKWL